MILLFKMDFSVLSGARIYLANRNGYVIESRYCNHRCYLIIMTDSGVSGGELLNLGVNTFTMIKIDISLT